MNFTSAPFLFLFLPLTLAAFYALRGQNAGHRRMTLLTLASAIFYAVSGWNNVLVIGASITANFLAGSALLAMDKSQVRKRRAIIWTMALANVLLLLGFKIQILGGEGPDGFTAAEDVLLPLALSFITFQQIGFLIACHRGAIEGLTLRRYLFFVLFFPQLVLGPIVRYENVARQLDEDALGKARPAWLAAGLAIFALALCKKLLIANQLAIPTNDIFQTALAYPIWTMDAWFGIVGFQLQLLFDFMAYGEMAIGLAMMVGFRVPLNFDRPQFSRDRADLWRRWHISFSTFMRGTVFYPLAKNWKWPIPVALGVTGILSGLWHGLGTTFVIWGILQAAILLALNLRSQRKRQTGSERLPQPVAIALTFLVTCLIGALFRAPDIVAARHVYLGLAGLSSPDGPATVYSSGLRWQLTFLLAALLAFAGPDIGQIFRGRWHFIELRPAAKAPPVHWAEGYAAFRPGWAWGMVTGLALAGAVLGLILGDGTDRFIYVQF